MIIGIGIDIVQTERCADWYSFGEHALGKWLVPLEIAYCKSIEAQSAQRFAARLAAKEAFYKAFAPLNTQRKTLFEVARAVSVVHDTQGAAQLECAWELLVEGDHIELCKKIRTHLSISHTSSIASAIVLLEAEKL